MLSPELRVMNVAPIGDAMVATIRTNGGARAAERLAAFELGGDVLVWGIYEVPDPRAERVTKRHKRHTESVEVTEPVPATSYDYLFSRTDRHVALPDLNPDYTGPTAAPREVPRPRVCAPRQMTREQRTAAWVAWIEKQEQR